MRWKNKDGLEFAYDCQHPAGEHYAEWGTKMESIGLMPSKTARRRWGQDGPANDPFIIDSGLFPSCCRPSGSAQFASQDSKFTLD